MLAEGSWIQGGGRSTVQAPGQIPSGAAASQPGAASVTGPLQHLPPGNGKFCYRGTIWFENWTTGI